MSIWARSKQGSRISPSALSRSRRGRALLTAAVFAGTAGTLGGLSALASAAGSQATPGPAAVDSVDQLLDRRTQGREWTTAQCGGCHTFDSVLSHPIGVAPSMEVPSHLPLVNGRIACSTCHEDSSSTLHAVARQTHDPMLRGGVEGVSFCMQCHDPNEVRMSSQHASMLGRAHLAPPDTIGAAAAASGRRGESTGFSTAQHGQAGGSSTSCLACHDGSVAGFVDHGSPGGGLSSGGFLQRSHPVSVEYPRDGHRGPFGSEYIPSSQLDERVQLVNGRVECISCHSPYSQLEHQLVMSNHGSTLCLSCHDM